MESAVNRSGHWLARARERFEGTQFTGLDSRLGVVLAVLLYVAVTLPSMGRHLWHDELYTYWIAKAPTAGTVLKWVVLDLQPPLSYLSVRASLAVFGDNEFAVRLPFTVAFLIGSLCYYRFVGRRLRPVYGLLAMLVFWSTPFLSYATEARPYALVVMFFGVALLAWERASAMPEVGRQRLWWVLALGFAVLGMMFSHFFSVIYLLPFGLAELWRWYEKRRPNWAVWVALLLPAVVPVLYLSQIHRYESSALPPVQQASPFKVFAFFYHTLDPEGIVLLAAVCLGLLAVFRPGRVVGVERRALMRPLDWVFVAGLLGIPLVLNVILMRTHGAFFPRYGMPALFAYGLLLAFFVASQTNLSRVAAAVACVVLMLSVAGTTAVGAALRTLRTWGQTTAAATVHVSALDAVKPELPLVAASGLTFFEMNKYETPETLKRVYYLNDRELAVKYAHATIFEGGFPKLKAYFPLKGNFAPYRQFVAEHPHFLVVGTPDYPEDWLIPRLMDVHAKLEYLGNFPIPYKDTSIYEVTMPVAGDQGQ